MNVFCTYFQRIFIWKQTNKQTISNISNIKCLHQRPKKNGISVSIYRNTHIIWRIQLKLFFSLFKFIAWTWKKQIGYVIKILLESKQFNANWNVCLQIGIFSYPHCMNDMFLDNNCITLFSMSVSFFLRSFFILVFFFC